MKSSDFPFSPATESWFGDTFAAPTEVQQSGWRSIRNGSRTLLVAPTGSGKTLAAFLAGIDYCLSLPADALAPTKRGAHLALSLERLAELCKHDPQRIGLSATVRPLDEVASFLGGRRAVDTVDLSARPHLDLKVVVPVPDMEKSGSAAETRRGGSILGELHARELRPPQSPERNRPF